jgi:hypothetical protein
VEDSKTPFAEKLPKLLQINDWLEEWQYSPTSRNKTLAASTFLILTRIMTGFYRLSKFMDEQQLTFELQTFVCSTLICEAGFAKIREILDTFTVLQFVFIQKRVRWELLTEKSSHERNFMPADNADRFHKAYGTVNAKVNKPKLERKAHKRTRAKQQMDKRLRQRVRQISKECYSNSKPGKLRSGLYTFKGPSLTLKCPDCANVFGHVSQLSTHLQYFHDGKFAEDTAQSTAVNIETEAITTQLSKQATGQGLGKDDDTLVVELPVICTPVTDIQLSKLPFQWTPVPAYNKASAVVLLDTETPSGYCFNKGGIISLAAMHEVDNFAKP